MIAIEFLPAGRASPQVGTSPRKRPSRGEVPNRGVGRQRQEVRVQFAILSQYDSLQSKNVLAE